MSRRVSCLIVVLAVLALLAGVQAVQASSFEFAGTSDNKGVHLHSQGRINFQWVPVTVSSSPGDPVENLYWGANDLHVFSAIGKPTSYVLKVGDSFTGLDYELAMWLDSSNLPNISAQDQSASDYTTWDFSGTMHITSISFPSQYDIVIGGYITDAVNRVLGSSVLTDLAAQPKIDFSINVVWNSRTAMSFLDALNSGNLSTWANINGSLGKTVPGTVPEPGTMGLLASALGMGGLLLRHRGWREMAGLLRS